MLVISNLFVVIYKCMSLVPGRKMPVTDDEISTVTKVRFGRAPLVEMAYDGSGRVFLDSERNNVHYVANSVYARLSAMNEDIGIYEFRDAMFGSGFDDLLVNKMISGSLLVPALDTQEAVDNDGSIPSIMVSLGESCNLACIYCYSNAVVAHKFIEKDVFRVAIRDLVSSACGKKEYVFRGLLGEVRKIRLGLIGGGEPTLNIQLFLDIVDAFRWECERLGVVPVYSLVSNGTFGGVILKSILDNRMDVMISLDGYADVQNEQRPFHDGSATYSVVMNNIRTLVRSGCPVQLTSTVTAKSLERMSEVVDLAKEENIGVVHIEPVKLSGRAVKSKADFIINPFEFCDGISSAFVYALKNGITLKGKHFPLTLPFRQYFCGACGFNRVVTSTGYISSCVEVSGVDGDFGGDFIIGRIDMGKECLDLWPDRLTELKRREMKNMNGCSDCFLRYNCAGGCPANSLRENGDMYEPVKGWCEAYRKSSVSVISELLAMV